MSDKITLPEVAASNRNTVSRQLTACGYTIALLLFATLTLVDVVAAAQQEKLHRIGVLLAGATPDPTSPNLQAFLRGLQELGYIDGKSIVIEYGPTDQKLGSVTKRLAHMIRSNVSLIVVNGTTNIPTVIKAIRTIPIVMVEAGNPVERGFVKSLALPGDNATGLSSPDSGLSSKRMDLLKETVQSIMRVAILNADLSRRSEEYAKAAKELGVDSQSFAVATSEDFTRVFSKLLKTRCDGLITVRNFLTIRHAKQIAEFAVANRLPSMFGSSDSVRAGGLMSYGVNYRAQWRRAAVFVDKILKGANPASLPIEPPQLEMAINLVTAGKLGVKIPPEILLEANEIIR